MFVCSRPACSLSTLWFAIPMTSTFASTFATSLCVTVCLKLLRYIVTRMCFCALISLLVILCRKCWVYFGPVFDLLEQYYMLCVFEMHNAAFCKAADELRLWKMMCMISCNLLHILQRNKKRIVIISWSIFVFQCCRCVNAHCSRAICFTDVALRRVSWTWCDVLLKL